MREKATNTTNTNTESIEAHQYDKIIRENINDVFVLFVINHLGFPITLEEFLPDKLFTTEEREMDLLLKLRDENGRVFFQHNVHKEIKIHKELNLFDFYRKAQ